MEKSILRRKAVRRLLILLLIVVLSPVLLLQYMKWEYKSIRMTPLDLASGDTRLHGIKIVYAVDFQYDMYADDGQAVEEKTFQKAVDTINSQSADIILLGGDYISFSSNHSYAAAYLQQLQAPFGVYSVFGNHDAGAKSKLIEELPNITFLENEAAYIAYNETWITVYGTEDLWTGNPLIELDAIEEDSYSILLTHNPDYYESMSQTERDAFDLILAGHTHAGQITFFGLTAFPGAFRVSAYGEKYRYGEKDYNGNRIYISSGLGGSAFHLPIRFAAHPEIVVIQ